MQADIAIVVVAFNRPDALRRLLNSLKNADYAGYKNIRLIISIDYSGKNDCKQLADEFEWHFGDKEILFHKENLGLKKHILQCGDFSLQHDAVIVLEDDLFVSPAFYDYAQQAYQFFQHDERIAGIGLYNYRFNEVAFCPFETINDGYDNYFLQVPCSSGQMWTRNQWTNFKSFLENGLVDNGVLPPIIAYWKSETSWKKFFYSYIIQSGKYFVYPSVSLTTNFGDVGQHHENDMKVWQTPLLLGKKNFRFSQLEDSTSVYDAYFELDAKVFKKLTGESMDICIDLNGSKPLHKIENQYLLSSRKSVKPLKKYEPNLYPYINNVLMKMDNDSLKKNYFSLGVTGSFVEEKNMDLRLIDVKRVFFNEEMLIVSGKHQVYQTKEYKLGKAILDPLLRLKRLFKF